jgi:hypothetical protein
MKRSRKVLLAVAAGSAAAALPGVAAAAKPKVGPPPPKLFATVGPNKLAFKNAQGRTVARLKAGWYTVEIMDSSTNGGFALNGPGVKKSTAENFRGAAIWGVKLTKGTYTYASPGETGAVPHRFTVT